jgi:hypothetical protein
MAQFADSPTAGSGGLIQNNKRPKLGRRTGNSHSGNAHFEFFAKLYGHNSVIIGPALAPAGGFSGPHCDKPALIFLPSD